MENHKVLANGVKMPSIGFGTYKSGSFQDTVEAVKVALKVGYRYIDTASFYDNEEGVGQGINESGIPRSEIFIATKIWQHEQGFESTMKAYERSISKLGVNYIDLYLVHWPTELNSETWRALEKLYSEGKVKAIGVCNFKINHLEELMKTAKVKPMINQIQLHPELTEEELVSYCEDQGVEIVSWGPLERGKIFSILLLEELGKKYNKTITQVTLRWHLQRGYIPIPKSTNKERIVENFNIFDFQLSDEDMIKIDGLNKNKRLSKAPEGTIF